MQIELEATLRQAQGTGASRRLRHTGRVPAIVYGGEAAPVMVELDHNTLYHTLKKPGSHNALFEVTIEGKKQLALLRGLQRHPWKPLVMHVDFQRIEADQKIHKKVPVRFINEENSPAVKLASAVINHVANEIEVVCLPGSLPEFITVDLGELQPAQSLHSRDLVLPEGVELALHGKADFVLASAAAPKGGSTDKD
ncbi:MAG: 50S ribosomal protein L25/general stress protein Ctc [Pseudomonadota bacterium]